MSSANALSTLQKLPANATNAEALAWLAGRRRVVDRWESLPEHDRRSMSPELRRQARQELDAVEHSVRRNMTLPAGA